MSSGIKRGPMKFDVAVRLPKGKWVRVQNDRVLTKQEVESWVELEVPLTEEQLEARNQRAEDHESSVAGARAARRTGRNQRSRLLEAWIAAGPEGLIDEEAADKAGLLITGVCHWKRAGELRALGYIEWDGRRRRKSTHGVLSRISVVTERGMRALPVGGA
jgi:hypothetical protein